MKKITIALLLVALSVGCSKTPVRTPEAQAKVDSILAEYHQDMEDLGFNNPLN